MRVSSAAGKSERIKTHQHNFYTPNLKEHVLQQWGFTDKFRHLVVDTSKTPYERSITNNRTPISLVKIGYRLLGHLPGLPWGQPQPRPQGTTPLFKWIYPQSQKPVHVIGRGPSTGD
ncbi:hypothetical protein M9H77_18053 [Catharanthus roseus]|uniref:Uncharacterized protein n=1 Tax=Catharanthus roseus TaxID=4058 RepID=A0ACC0B6D4_CATRO|nr:hypothetical protein M9H77_18053 [Catharanthus roseus]